MIKNVKRAASVERLMPHLLMICGFVSVTIVLCICAYLIVSGIPAIREIGPVKFLFGTVWQSTSSSPSFGILPFILASVYGTAGALLIGIPIGIFAAVALAKFASKKRRRMLKRMVALLAGIPSVIYGLVGMIVLVPGIQNGFQLSSGATLLAAMLVLAVMVLPTMINVSVSALEAVPESYEAASLALGATETETYFKVSIPAAKSGIAAAVVMGVGRAIGEAMAIIMVSGNVSNMPGLLKPVRFMTTAIASEMSYAAAGSLQRNALYSIGLILFIFILILNVILNLFIKGKRRGKR